MFSLVDRTNFPTTILRMNIEQIEQTCAETLLEYANTMASAYVSEPEDFPAAVTALLARTLENHLNRPVDIDRLLKPKV